MSMLSPSKGNKKKIQATEEIRELESYIKDFRRFLPLPVCYTNSLNIILDVNENLEHFSGYKLTEIVGEGLEKLFVDHRKVEKIEKEMLEKGEIFDREITFLTKEKKQIPVGLSAMSRKDKEGDVTGYFLSIVNLTEFKRAEEERKKAAVVREKAELIDAMPDALIVLDLNGVILNINPAMVELLGYTSEERVGKSFNELGESIKAEDIERFMKLLGKLVETGEAKPIETVLRAKDGRKIPCSITYSLIKDAKGNPKNIVTMLRDIIELKRAEEKRIAAGRKAARAEEAEEYSKVLEAKVKDLEDFRKLAIGRALEMKKKGEELKKKLEEKDG